MARVAVAGLLALPLILLGRASVTRWSVIVGGLVLGPLYAIYLLAVENVGAGLASILLYTAPLWVTIASPWALREIPTSRTMAALPLGLAGVLLIASPSGESRVPATGLALGLASGLMYAAYLLLARLAQKRGAHSEEVGIASLPLALPGVLLVARPQCGLGVEGVLPALYLGLMATLVPYFLNAYALSRIDSSRVSIVSLVEPLTAVLLGVVLLGERLTASQVLGGALILSSVALVGGGEKRGS